MKKEVRLTTSTTVKMLIYVLVNKSFNHNQLLDFRAQSNLKGVVMFEPPNPDTLDERLNLHCNLIQTG